jgi:hypothetical protein
VAVTQATQAITQATRAIKKGIRVQHTFSISTLPPLEVWSLPYGNQASSAIGEKKRKNVLKRRRPCTVQQLAELFSNECECGPFLLDDSTFLEESF